MAIFTIKADPETARVSITLDNVFGITGIIRDDANGSRLVRLRAGGLPANGTVTITDYEASISGRIRYRTVGTLAEPAWTTLAGDGRPRFILPTKPYFFVAPDLVHNYSAGRTTRATFHEVINRPDPLVSEAPLGTRSGSLDVWFDSYMGARDLEDLIGRGLPVMYRQAEHPGMDMYFYAVSSGITPDEDAWRLALEYREILSPAGSILPAASWTFDAFAAAGGTFDSRADDYNTFHDLAINEAKP
jgi:hypothetical protein